MIKRICETELGIISQCCQPRQASKLSKQYCENVALKINVKVCTIMFFCLVGFFFVTFSNLWSERNEFQGIVRQVCVRTEMFDCIGIKSLCNIFFVLF